MKAIYGIPTEGKIPTQNIALAVQRIFYRLQTSDRPVGALMITSLLIILNVGADTTELTKSFGWRPTDSFDQHDAQEFNRILQDKLSEVMKVRARLLRTQVADIGDSGNKRRKQN